ncbi:Calx-beta domain-containing protein [Rubrimonas cliftonensis]|uniref:Calx-beta domain-containing protein n=1 Tax=Rubrimonas cliftonensis TaxID=89524 RepID=UPI001FE0035A|nr:Calx-beta domain-containing protein [Rubrimonas cliftonensis]
MVFIESVASNFEGDSTSDVNDLIWTISLSAASTEEVTVFYRLLAGTGSVGSNSSGDPDAYGALERSVTFAPGETSKTVSYAISGDSVDEVDEAVVLEVFSASNAALAGGAPALRSTGWILDDDGTGNNLALYVSRPLLVEGDAGQTQASFEVSLSRPAPEAFTAEYTTIPGSATPGEDYETTTGALDFAVGQTTASVTVPVFGDMKVEPKELFTLGFTAPSLVAATSIGSAEILDDDAGGAAPTVNVSPASNFEGDSTSDVNDLIWTISLSAASTEEVTVFYRLLAGTGSVGSNSSGDPDAYGALERSVTFAPGETSKTVSYAISGDSVDEVDEAVVLEVFSASNAALAGLQPRLRSTGWILDDDGDGNNLAIYVGEPFVLENVPGGSVAAIEISLSRPAPVNLSFNFTTVSGSAVSGVDFEPLSGTVVFTKGQTTTAVNVPIIGDAVSELDETFTLDLSPTSALASGEAGTDGVTTIVDNDPPLLLSAGPDRVGDEGGTITQTIVVTDAEDDGAPGRLVEIDEDGDGVADRSFTTAALSFDIDVTLGDGDAVQTVTVTVTDGDESAADGFDVMVGDVAPTATVSLPSAVDEGSAVTATVSGFADPGGDAATLLELVDGSDAVLASLANPDLSGPVQLSAVLPDGDATVDLFVRATNADGVFTLGGGAVTVTDVAPTADAEGPAAVEVGATYTLTLGPVIDPGDDAVTEILVDFGDGAGPRSFAPGAPLTTVYAAPGVFDVSVSVVNEDGTFAVDAETVTVSAAPVLVVSAGPDRVGDEGGTITQTIVVTDAEDDGAPGRLVEIDEDGDGVADRSFTTAALSFDIDVTLGDGDAVQTVTVTVTDGDESAADGFDVMVGDVAPTATVSLPSAVDEGSAVTATVSGFADPGGDAATLLELVDGSDAVLASLANPDLSGPVQLSAVLPDGDATVDLFVRATNADGVFTLGGGAVTVTDVAPTADAEGPAAVEVGATYTLTLGPVIDPGDDAVTEILVDFGDGAGPRSFAPGAPLTTVYAAPGVFDVSVSVVNEDGTFAVDAETVTVTGGRQPQVVGTPGRDVLAGGDSAEGEEFLPNGGYDFVTTGLGADTIRFNDVAGQRDVLTIADFDPNADRLELDGRSVTKALESPSRTVLLLDGPDGDAIVLLGVGANPFDAIV